MFGYGGFGGYGGGYRRWLWLWWPRLRRRVRFDYSIVYLVNYHWCSCLELKKALFSKGLFLIGDGFALFIVLFILLIIAGVTYWYYI